MLTFLIEVERPRPKRRPIHQHPISPSIHLGPIIKQNVINRVACDLRVVDTHRKAGFHSTVDLVSPAQKVVVSDRRMVADLLEIHRASVDPVLDGFPEDGVEWFLEVYLQVVVGD